MCLTLRRLQRKKTIQNLMLHDIVGSYQNERDDKCANSVSFIAPYKHFPKTEYRFVLSLNAKSRFWFC